MSQVIEFPAPLKALLLKSAATRKFPAALAILARGGPEELVVESQGEAQTLVDIARLDLLEARLKYPFWDEDLPNHDPAHEDAFHDVQMGIFEKTVMYVGQAFEIVSKV
jgi:hypothetical protein